MLNMDNTWSTNGKYEKKNILLNVQISLYTLCYSNDIKIVQFINIGYNWQFF